MGSIFKKLIEFQSKCNGVTLDGFNPHFKSKFCTLGNLVSTVTPVLSSVGLGFYHIIKQEEDYIFIETRIIDADTERYISSSLNIPLNSNPQKLGAVLTYYKRYQLAGLLGVAEAGDDDGETAEEENKKAPAITSTKFIEGINFFKTDKHSADDLDKWYASKEDSFLLLDEPDKKEVDDHYDSVLLWIDKHGKFGSEKGTGSDVEIEF